MSDILVILFETIASIKFWNEQLVSKSRQASRGGFGSVGEEIKGKERKIKEEKKKLKKEGKKIYNGN